MSEHLGFDQETIEARSPQGEINIDELRLNNDKTVEYRERAIELSKALVDTIFALKGSSADGAKARVDRAVTLLSTLTYQTEENIRSVCKV